MIKFTKLTICAVVVLFVIGTLSSTAFADSFVARQDDGDATPTYDGGPDATPDATPLPPIPFPNPAKAPDAPVTTAKISTVPSPSPSGAPLPTGTGSLIPGFSSLLSLGPQPTAPPPYKGTPSTGPGAASTPATGAGHKIENSLISGAIIAGVVGLFM